MVNDSKSQVLFLILLAMAPFCFAATSPPVPKVIEVRSSPSSGNSRLLRLEAFITPATSVFPGQRLKFTYKIYYQASIDLIVEQLPLLEPQGFQKIGQKEIRDFIENQSNVQEISQEVRALNPGSFQFPPSIIEGLAYEEDIAGNHVYQKMTLHSEVPAKVVEVLEFPKKDQPLSFNGALGRYTLAVRLLTPNKILIGDEIQLEVNIEGVGEFEMVELPDLSCQPGFSGFFRFSDLPPQTALTDTSKQFILSLRPISTFVKEIPSIEFSFFDPNARQYGVVKSAPIPLTVGELPADHSEDHEDLKQEAPLKKEEAGAPWRVRWEHPEDPKWNPVPLLF